MTLLEKIDLLIKNNNLNKRQFSIKSEIPYSTVDGWYKIGYESMKLTTFKTLCTFFNVTMDSMAYDGSDIQYRDNVSTDTLNKEENALITSYRGLDIYGRGTVKDFVNRLKNQPVKVIKILPSLGKIAAAGTPAASFSIMSDETIEIEADAITKEADYAIGVSGDSMEPEYRDGDIVLVKRTTDIAYNEIGIFQVDNEVYIKQYTENGLHSFNNKYENMINENILCLGKVIAKI